MVIKGRYIIVLLILPVLFFTCQLESKKGGSNNSSNPDEKSFDPDFLTEDSNKEADDLRRSKMKKNQESNGFIEMADEPPADYNYNIKSGADGKIVKIQYRLRDQGIELGIPDGKVWIPLYYEVSNCPDSYYSPPYIYPEKLKSGGYYKPSRYKFPEKENFISNKHSSRNNKALAGRYQSAVKVDGIVGCKQIVYTLFFLEE